MLRIQLNSRAAGRGVALVFVLSLASVRAAAQEFGTPVELPGSSASTPSTAAPVAEPPRAPERAPRFGDAGEVVLTASTAGANYGWLTSTSYESGAHERSGALGVGLDAFVVPHVSIGFDLEATASSGESFSSDSALTKFAQRSFGVGVRLGVDVPISRKFSWYPRLTLGLAWRSNERQTIAGGPTADSSEQTKWGHLFLPFLFHPRPHLFLGLGPDFSRRFGDPDTDPSQSAIGASYGVSFVFGGWWGGAAPAVEGGAVRETSAPAAIASRFGERKQLVLSAESGASFGATRFSVADATSGGASVRAGVDYFIGENVSFGVVTTSEYARSQSVDANGLVRTAEAMGFGIAARFGVALPLVDAVALHPRVVLGVGSVHATLPADSTTASAWVALEAPVILTVATHFFVGVGPYVRRDLINDRQFAGSSQLQSNTSSTLGAEALVGGWL